MNMRVVWGVVGVAILAWLGGCGKSGGGGTASSTDKKPPIEIAGVKVDTPQLVAAFSRAPVPLFTQVNEVDTKVYYGLYDKAIAQLEDLQKMPGLNDQQKALIPQVIDQLKQVAAKAPAGQPR